MTATEVFIKRRRLMRQHPGRFQQNEVATEAGISSNTLVDIEREKITVSEADLKKIDDAMERMLGKVGQSTLSREEVMA